jgi:uncharacterized protein (TIGR02391 family)
MASHPQAQDLASLPVDELALWLLRLMLSSKAATFGRVHFLGQVLKNLGHKMPGDSAYRQQVKTGIEPPHIGRALAEAWGWLVAEGLIAEAATAMLAGQMPIEGYFFVTRFGERLASHPQAHSWIAAERRLGLTLHPRLEERARRQFILGEFEAAALVAMREVEIAVRERSGLPATMLGTDLMNKAFAELGQLTDAEAPKAEQEGLRSLYRGAISVFKNPASHRRLSYDDPVEAAEIVLFADLLLRMIDQAEDAPAPT